MKQYKGYGNYEKHPAIQIDTPACTGTQAIAEAIRARCTEKEKTIVVFECYPGTSRAEIDAIAAALSPCVAIDADECAFAPEKLTAAIKDDLTEDRVFGKMTTAHLSDYYESDRIAAAQSLRCCRHRRLFDCRRRRPCLLRSLPLGDSAPLAQRRLKLALPECRRPAARQVQTRLFYRMAACRSFKAEIAAQARFFA